MIGASTFLFRLIVLPEAGLFNDYPKENLPQYLRLTAIVTSSPNGSHTSKNQFRDTARDPLAVISSGRPLSLT